MLNKYKLLSILTATLLCVQSIQACDDEAGLSGAAFPAAAAAAADAKDGMPTEFGAAGVGGDMFRTPPSARQRLRAVATAARVAVSTPTSTEGLRTALQEMGVGEASLASATRAGLFLMGVADDDAGRRRVALALAAAFAKSPEEMADTITTLSPEAQARFPDPREEYAQRLLERVRALADEELAGRRVTVVRSLSAEMLAAAGASGNSKDSGGEVSAPTPAAAADPHDGKGKSCWCCWCC